MAEEIEYEALPSNAGLGVNMLAGAMVRLFERTATAKLTVILGRYIRARCHVSRRQYQGKLNPLT